MQKEFTNAEFAKYFGSCLLIVGVAVSIGFKMSQREKPIVDNITPTYTPAPTYAPVPVYTPVPTFIRTTPTYTPPEPTYTPPEPTYTPPEPTYTPPEPTYPPAPTYTPPESRMREQGSHEMDDNTQLLNDLCLGHISPEEYVRQTDEKSRKLEEKTRQREEKTRRSWEEFQGANIVSPFVKTNFRHV